MVEDGLRRVAARGSSLGTAQEKASSIKIHVLVLSDLLRPFLGLHDTLRLSETSRCLQKAYRDDLRRLSVGFPWETTLLQGRRSPCPAGLIGLLGSSKRLRELELRGAVATGVALEAMGKGRWDPRGLQTLVLRDMGMPGMATRLAEVLASGTPKSLQTLDVSSNCLSDKNTGAICQALVAGGLVKGLQELRMQGNDVRNDTLHALQALVAEAGQLRVLGLGVAQAGVGGRREESDVECLKPMREVVAQVRHDLAFVRSHHLWRRYI